MTAFWQLIQEIWQNRRMTRLLARFNVKTRWADNYLGAIWDYLEPLIYIGTYFVVFGLGLYRGKVGDTPYIVWLMTGIVPWYCIQGATTKGLTSIRSQVNLLTKTNYPLSIAPIVPVYEEFHRFLGLSVVELGILLAFHVWPSIYWLQLAYVLPLLFISLAVWNTLNATLTMLIPDYADLFKALMRVFLFTSGIIVNLQTLHFPEIVRRALELSPIYYVIQTCRETVLGQGWFWERGWETAFFWVSLLLVAIIAAMVQVRHRDTFVDQL